MTNSIDVLRPLAEALDKEPIEVQIIGGVNSAALVHPDTVIDADSKTVIAPSLLHLPTQRNDAAKTRRDLDILVKSSNPDVIERVERIVDETVGTALERSVFGIVPEKVLRRQLRHRFGFTALKTFLSDRYVHPDDIDTPDGVDSPDRMIRSLFPFGVPIDSESLESWTLTVGDMHVPIPNPAMSIINYTTRSISGVRPKDKKKLKK